MEVPEQVHWWDYFQKMDPFFSMTQTNYIRTSIRGTNMLMFYMSNLDLESVSAIARIGPYASRVSLSPSMTDMNGHVVFFPCSTRTDLPCKQSDGSCSSCLSSDDSIAEQNAIFLDAWLQHGFPEFAGRPLYLVGESYAGV